MSKGFAERRVVVRRKRRIRRGLFFGGQAIKWCVTGFVVLAYFFTLFCCAIYTAMNPGAGKYLLGATLFLGVVLADVLFSKRSILNRRWIAVATGLYGFAVLSYHFINLLAHKFGSWK
ncbi:MAG: hypothetical protein JSS87_00885 [Acidobacteria bacterium]|nr:hypothetical protein [Acidobacteriota bacterium]